MKIYNYIMDIFIHLGFWFALAMMIVMSVLVYKEFKNYPQRQLEREYMDCYSTCERYQWGDCLKKCVSIYSGDQSL
jgi:hypothetical protein